MAKKARSEMTPEELAAARAISKEKREKRREDNKEAISEIVALLSEEQVAKLSEKAQHLVKVLMQEYKPGVVLDIKPGDSIVELLMVKYKDVKNMAKKLEKWCADNNCKLDYAKGIVCKA